MFTNQQNSGFSFCQADDGGKWGTKQPQHQERHEDWSDADLAKEMNELSVQEREQVLDDIHGVAKAVEETTEFVATCLKKLDKAISRLPKTKRKALDRATFLKPSLQKDVKFKLMFLRADYYDARNAANRMARYFSNKLKLFGEEKLAGNITFDDLTKQDMEFFIEGSMVELPNRDQTGRPIWFVDTSKCDWNNPTSLVRPLERIYYPGKRHPSCISYFPLPCTLLIGFYSSFDVPGTS
jgi:hypothetical protein